MKGSINTTTTFCMPAKLEDAEIPASSWSVWEPWSKCSVSCGKGGTKFRNRVCQIPQNHLRHLDCKGEPIQVRECEAKQKVCPPPPRMFSHVPIESEESEEKEKDAKTKQPSNNIIWTREDVRKELKAWMPLKDGDSKSPCTCGCIYIVTGNQRTATITSSQQCYSLPIIWKIKVPNNKTISATLDLVEFSCLNSVLKIRDPMRGNEIIHIERTTFEKTKIVSSIHNKTNVNSKRTSELNHYEERKSNKTENSLKSENGQILILEYLAPRRSCRVNIKVTAFANDPNMHKTNGTGNVISYYFEKLMEKSKIQYFYHKHPMIIISLLSIFLVTSLCVACLVCQFKYEKRKYHRWFEEQHQNKFRRKSSSLYSNSLYLINSGQNGYVPVNTKTNIEEEDVETIASIMEDDHLLLGPKRKVSRRKLIQILNRRFQKASQILQMQMKKNENLNHRMCRANSIPLPCEPFKRAKDDNHVYENTDNLLSDSNANRNSNDLVNNELITASQVKHALASKMKRCKKGTYSVKILKNRSPPPAPSSSPIPSEASLIVTSSLDGTNTIKRKRYSRSFSDLLSIIELDESKTEKLLTQRRVSNDNNASLNTNNNNVSNKTAFTTTTTASIETIVQNQEYPNIDDDKVKDVGCKKIYKNVQMSDTESCSSLYHLTGSTTNCEASHQSTLSRKRRRLIDKQTKNRLNERRMSRKRMLANQQQLLLQKGMKNGDTQLASMSSNSTLNSISQSESLNTLKPPKGRSNVGVGGGQQSSLSEFSEHSSMELDLEFDLYDCDLNNVIASNQPGSMFAHQNNFYDFYDFDDDEDLGALTPTPSRTEFDVLIGEPIQVRECKAKQEVCPPPPRIFSHDSEKSGESEKEDKDENKKKPL